MSVFQKINQEKAAQLLFVLFLAAALWEQFAPQAEPGMMEYNQATLVMKADPSPDEVKKACELFAAAVRAGNKDAAFGLSDCIGNSHNGSELQRNSIRYALLTIAMDARHSTRSARNERDALGLTEAQKAEALKLDVLRILSGEFSSLDLAGKPIVR